jgi:ketosteroid isomerase-like protein
MRQPITVAPRDNGVGPEGRLRRIDGRAIAGLCAKAGRLAAVAEQHNVELVRSIYATGCWDIGVDPTPALTYLSEEFEFVNDPEAAMPGTRHGREGFAIAMQSADDALEYFRHEPLAYTALGEHVLVDIMLHARGRSSQVALSRPEWHVWTLRDGKADRVQWFKDEAAARAYAGLG